MQKVAIMVDGGFFQKRYQALTKGPQKGKQSAAEVAAFLVKYCQRHAEANDVSEEPIVLYRIFYYDCMPSNKILFNPLTKGTEELGKSDQYKWMMDFFKELKKKRKVAIRRGVLSDDSIRYGIKLESVNKIIDALQNGKTININQNDLVVNIKQKGVDMRLGLDIASLAYKKQVDKIILIAGDSDFVPAAKLARREGIDFVLDPLWNNIKDDLFEHIDGMKTCKDLLPRPPRCSTACHK
ncbi:NYN domain-containing protein [Phascolarctobacterium sp.]|uniref:NYN domain-containing protein n=1 Tax=Phascolarctobacterium sp. TaxID=2049039 RepID=UPI0030775972